MSEKAKGGQAFPCLERGGNGLDLTDGGMTLRDYFAAKAMHAILSTPKPTYELRTGNDVAHIAYEMADAMLKERNQ